MAALLKAHPPESRQLYVDITADRLTIRLDPQGGGNLTIREVGSGTVAQELGIRNETGTGTNPIVGKPLQPVLRNTTALDNIFGSYAAAVVHSRGRDNDIRLKADAMGASDHRRAGPQRHYGRLSAGQFRAGRQRVRRSRDQRAQPATYGACRLRRHEPRFRSSRPSTRPMPIGSIPFTADLDPLDNTSGGLGYVELNALAKTDGGWGEPLDKSHGLRIQNSRRRIHGRFLLRNDARRRTERHQRFRRRRTRANQPGEERHRHPLARSAAPIS